MVLNKNDIKCNDYMFVINNVLYSHIVVSVFYYKPRYKVRTADNANSFCLVY